MANRGGQQRCKIARWRDRPVITLNEKFGRERLLHGIVIGPPGMSHSIALRRLDEVFQAVVAAAPEEWTYEDVFNHAAGVGFEVIQAAEWWEDRVELNPD